MRAYSLSHLPDAVLLRDLSSLVVEDRATTATLLAHIAEVDSRQLYVPAGYSSMFAYCVDELRLSEDAAYKRIQAARAAREFPALFEALAEGRLHLTAIRLLAPYLTPENVEELVTAATHRRKSEIEELLARRFPPRAPAVAASLAPIRSTPVRVLAPGQVEIDPAAGAGSPACASPPDPPAPTPAETFALRVTIDRTLRDKLRYAQELLSHAVPSGDVAQVLDRALDSLIGQLERKRFGAWAKPRSSRRAERGRRLVPAHVRRAVWARDGGRCSFVGDTGRRCGERRRIELDHVEPVARGGTATVEGMRLRCRAHNQYEAERAFGRGFMERKREAARRERAARAARGPLAEAEAGRESVAGEDAEHSAQILAGLRHLGFKVSEARLGVEHSRTPAGASLEERMRAALQHLCPRPAMRAAAGSA